MKPNLQPLSRRTFLQGLGVAIALPALEGMLTSRAGAETLSPRRFIAIQTTQGIMPDLFFPQNAGAEYAPSHYLKILEPLRSEFTVFSGLSHPNVNGGHINEKCFLTGAPDPTSASFKNSISLDQEMVERLSPNVRFQHLNINVNKAGTMSMSYNRAGIAIPGIRSASELFKKLFVQGTEQEVERTVNRLKAGQSVLDFASARAKSLNDGLGAADRRRMDQYCSAVRELEQDLVAAQAWEYKPKPKIDAKPPADINEPGKMMDQWRVLNSVVKLALETDSTRIVTMFLDPLGVLAGIPGVSHETHSLTHHGNRPEMVEELKKIEETQFGVVRDFMTGLRDTKEGQESLLDRTALLYGTCMGNANGHTNSNWPMLLAGGGFKHGQHLAFDKVKNEPLANLYVSILQRMGVESSKFASGSKTLRGLEMR